jgi:hypothetical protein
VRLPTFLQLYFHFSDSISDIALTRQRRYFDFIYAFKKMSHQTHLWINNACLSVLFKCGFKPQNSQDANLADSSYDVLFFTNIKCGIRYLIFLDSILFIIWRATNVQYVHIHFCCFKYLSNSLLLHAH